MEVNQVLRYVILLLSALASIAGVLILAGVLVPRNPDVGDALRIAFGAVLLFYGVYRFVATWYRRPKT